MSRKGRPLLAPDAVAVDTAGGGVQAFSVYRRRLPIIGTRANVWDVRPGAIRRHVTRSQRGTVALASRGAAMTLTRRPYDRNQMPVRSALERLVGDWPFLQMDGGLSELAPPLDVRETDDAYIVEVDLPGMEPKDVEILIEGRTLTIRGEMRQEREQRQGEFLVRERRQGRFMRAVALPGMVDAEQASSRYENGQLTITLPKSQQNRARRIEIPASGTQDGSTTDDRPQDARTSGSATNDRPHDAPTSGS
jgi:HSP20 family protein